MTTITSVILLLWFEFGTTPSVDVDHGNNLMVAKVCFILARLACYKDVWKDRGVACTRSDDL